jgi:hypothetical protein
LYGFAAGKTAENSREDDQNDATESGTGRMLIDAKISIKILFTFSVISCIVILEQSKRQRVKCHRDGEFARRTKEVFHDAVTAPAVAYRKTSFM